MHHSLKERRRVFKAEVHYLRNEHPMLHLKRRFVLVFLCDSNIIISPADIKLGEERLVPQILQGLLDIWQGVVVTYRPFVYFAVVHDDVFFFQVLLVYEVHGRGVWRGSFFNPPQFQLFS